MSPSSSLHIIFCVAVIAIRLLQILLALLLGMHRKPILIDLLPVPGHLEGVWSTSLAFAHPGSAVGVMTTGGIVAGAGFVTLGSPNFAAFGFFDERLE